MGDVLREMREDWNARARQDAYFYAGFGRRGQDDLEFLRSAAGIVARLEQEFFRLPSVRRDQSRALEIGCGPGRLLLPMSRHFGEVHGVDISEEMIAIARRHLQRVSNARLHVTPGSGLPMFADEFFDFIYSYVVFQHIPDRGVVWSYLRESKRVLKTGGILVCQLRGTPPLDSERKREPSTWLGCSFESEELAAFSREQDFHIVALSGLETQYLWTTFRKPGPAQLVDFSCCRLKAVTSTTSSENRVPARGRGAAVSLWIDGLPAACHLGNLLVAFDGFSQRGCYLSPADSGGACQLDARLPPGLSSGPISVGLVWDGKAVSERHSIIVLEPPSRQPRVLSITDGMNLASDRRVEMGGVKVIVEDVERPEAVSFLLAGRAAEYLQFERKDPITDTYEFAFHLSRKTLLGRHLLEIRVPGYQLPPEPVEVAGLE